MFSINDSTPRLPKLSGGAGAQFMSECEKPGAIKGLDAL